MIDRDVKNNEPCRSRGLVFQGVDTRRGNDGMFRNPIIVSDFYHL